MVTWIPEYRCADDLMQAAIGALLHSEDHFEATRGTGREILGTTFRLMNPRARLSRSETRGRAFSALGDLFWCLAGSRDVSFIEHYIPDYGKENSDDGATVHGAYGPRMFAPGDVNQVQRIIGLLREKPYSRRAVIQLFAGTDLEHQHKDVPCTCTLQAILRDSKLHLIAHMRSNDAYLGLPHDIFVFTMLQEMMACALDVDVGFYQHMVGNLHLYEGPDGKEEAARTYLEEEWQSIWAMPPMPRGNPFALLPSLTAAEAAIRRDPQATLGESFEPYWAELLLLLRIHSEIRHKANGYNERVSSMKDKVNSMYHVYIPSMGVTG